MEAHTLNALNSIHSWSLCDITQYRPAIWPILLERGEYSFLSGDNKFRLNYIGRITGVEEKLSSFGQA